MNYINKESEIYTELWRYALQVHPMFHLNRASDKDKAMWFDAMFDKMNKFWNFEQEVDRAINHLIKMIQVEKND